jgi:hypothetical protein
MRFSATFGHPLPPADTLAKVAWGNSTCATTLSPLPWMTIIDTSLFLCFPVPRYILKNAPIWFALLAI